MKLYLFTIAIVAITFYGFSQKDYSDFKPLQSVGVMPADFKTYTSEKIETSTDGDIEGVSRRDQKDFLKGIYYGIDQIIHSGKVLYGDPISSYVKNIGEKIVAKDPSLQGLRFYTLRSNVVNALSTKQGIIFVTEGLIAQLANEAQLAFILAHEIAHYKRDHVVQGYVERIELQRNRVRGEKKIKELSQYSKDKEFEADSIGIALYHDAGYSKKSLYDVFDVLAYSYLPFDLAKVPKDYFNSDLMYVPESFFAEEIPEISTDKNYDDSKSSHPNIEARSSQLESIMEEYSRWGDINYYFSEEDFMHVRTLARFENVRNDLYNFRYAEALYNILLLEKNHPNNMYLERSKGQAWAGLIMGKCDGHFFDHVVKPSLVQGDPHQVHHFLRKLSKKQLLTVGLRHVTDLKNKYPTDKEIVAIYNYTVELLSTERLFKLSNYEDKTYEAALSEFEASKQAIEEEKESEIDTEVNEELSKYDKIKQQADKTKARSLDDTFDHEEFYIYALSDLVNDTEFKNLLEKYEALEKEREEGSLEYQALSDKEKKKYDETVQKRPLRLGYDNVLLLEPQIQRIDKRNRLDIEKSEVLQIKLNEVFYELNSKTEIEIYKIGRSQYPNEGTAMYNERSLLLNAIMQMAEYTDSKIFPADFSLYSEIIERYGTSKVAFTFLQSKRNSLVTAGQLMGYMLFPPYALIGLPLQMTKMFITEFNALVFDMEHFEVEAYVDNEFYGVTSKATLAALFYDLTNDLYQENTKK